MSRQDRATYLDPYLSVIDIVSKENRLLARRVIFKNEFGSVEKEYHKVFSGNGVPDPLQGGGGRRGEDD